MDGVLEPLIFPAQADATADMFGFIVTERFRNRAKHALIWFAERGHLAAREADRLAAEIDSAEIGRNAVWHFSAGVFDDPQELERSPSRCADQLMVSLAAVGIPLSYRFQSQGTKIYSPLGHVIDAGRVDGISAADGTVEYRHADRGAPAGRAASDGVAVMPHLKVDGHRIDFMTEEVADRFCTASIEHEIMDGEELRRRDFARCIDGIRTHAPVYSDWCLTAVSSIIPLGPSVTGMLSGSQGACPGQIYMSGALSDIKTAEMLIHEASHQYFKAIETVVRLTRRGEDEEFWSPVARRNRPLHKLLLGYHAFANVLIYMKAARPRLAGQDAAFVESNIASVTRDLDELAQGIEASTTLTEHGAFLWGNMKHAVLAS